MWDLYLQVLAQVSLLASFDQKPPYLRYLVKIDLSSNDTDLILWTLAGMQQELSIKGASLMQLYPVV